MSRRVENWCSAVMVLGGTLFAVDEAVAHDWTRAGLWAAVVAANGWFLRRGLRERPPS